jgi:hypothetical protein
MRRRLSALRRLMCAGPLVLMAALAAQADPGPAWLVPSVFVSQDSEDFLVSKVGAGVVPLYRNGNDYAAIKAANHRYAVADWSAQATQVSVAATTIDAKTGLGYQGSLGLNDLGGRQLLTADIDYSRSLSDTTQGGLFLNRDWVETRSALTQGISHTFLGGSVEQHIAPRWTVIGLLGQQLFSDGNVRSHLRARLIHDLLPELGLNLQYRYRHFWNSSPYSGYYFSPDVYEENMLALGLRRRIDGWMLAGTLGLGQQKVSSDPETATHLAELELTSPLAGRIFFKTRTGFSDSAAFSGPNYIYRYLQLDLIFAF